MENVPAKVNILLVDDQPSRLLSYEAILESLGETLVSARSGEEALKRLMEGEYAVILLDVSMPGMDGFETAELIHQHPRFENTPIIFVTGVHIDELDRLQGYRLGAIDYVQVPVIADILRSKVAVLVELYRKRHALSALNRTLVGQNASLAQANVTLQTKRTEEFQALSETLAAANAELSDANARLQTEVAVRTRAEEHTLALAHKLREADKRKDVFLATLAHELRNPLAPIRSALALLKQMHVDPLTSTRSIDVIDRQVGQLVRLVDDLLDISRITYDRIDLRRERTFLSAPLAAAVEMAAPLMFGRAQKLDVDISSEAMLVDGDPQRLAQVFGNLLSNASKYTQENGEIRLTARAQGANAVISVSDNGIGIPADRLDAIFDLFVQVDGSMERSQGGLGIGLTLVKRLVDMHDGNVVVTSMGLDRGSRFEVSLPLIRDVPAQANNASVDGTASGGRRVLVIDDNRDAADMLVMSLEMIGHISQAIYEPLSAMETIATFAPEIAFLDIGMPKLSGLELARLIRSTDFGRDMILVALTGWGQPDDLQRSKEAGFDHHVVKPIALQEVERICNSATRDLSAN
jgi:signal transduction histidine kinase